MIHLDVPARRLSTGILCLTFLLLSSSCLVPVAQAVVIPWVGPNNGDFNNDANWTGGLYPIASANEAGAINNGTTAVLSAAAQADMGGLTLGAVASGRLQINNTGSLNLVAGSTETGALVVGTGGRGHVTVNGGGSLTATSIAVNGLDGGITDTQRSSVTLGDGTGLTTTFSSNGVANFNRNLRVNGPNVNFTANGGINFGGSSLYVTEIRHASNHSALRTAGTAALGGTLRPTFVSVTPTVGNAWNLVDANSVIGNFTLDLSSAPALASPTQGYVINRINGGTNGKLVQLKVEQLLQLEVNRGTGEIKMRNPGTSGAISIDGYTIFSANGSLTGSWNSLQDQGQPGWQEAAPVNTELSELNPQSSSSIGNGATLPSTGLGNLGNPYQAKTAPGVLPFGVDPDDISFEYQLPDGNVRTGVVSYSGTKVWNDLIINVNKSTGAVQLKNDSPYDVFIDGYSVHSAAGRLQPANGQWLSLSDQGVSGWLEASPLTTVVSELRGSGMMRLTANTGYSLGTLYNTTGGIEDLRFEFLTPGNETPQIGGVQYGAFAAISAPTPGVRGDYNQNGTVDAADYVVWRNAVGTNTVLRNDPIGGQIGTAQYNLWRANFGLNFSGGSGAGPALIPEPSAVLLVLAGVALVAVPARRRGVRLEL